jgi:hypothetical protein
MGAMVQVHANAVLDASTDQSGASVRLTTGPLKCRLMTANGSATSAGTELTTGGGYTAPSTFSATFGAASAGTASNSAAVTITNMPAATIVGVELWDSAGTPLRKWWGALSANKTTNAGDTFSIAIASLTLSLP